LPWRPLAKSLLAEDVIEKVDAHSFFIGGPDHEIIKRQLKTGKKLLSFVPVNFSQIPPPVRGDHRARHLHRDGLADGPGVAISRWARTTISPRRPPGGAGA